MGNDSIQNMSGAGAAKKIQEMAEGGTTCMMMTSLGKRPFSVRPMAIQKTDQFGRIYFLSGRDTDKNNELMGSDEMHITIASNSSAEYLSLYGHAEVYRSQQEIDEMYSKFMDTWFDGKEDPNINIIRFDPQEGHYWDTKNGKIVYLAGVLAGMITGKETDNTREGDLKLKD